MQHQDWHTVVLRPKKQTEKRPHRDRSSRTSRNLDSDDPVMTAPARALQPSAIIAARQARGWKQKDLAQKLNVTAAVVQAWENGRAAPQGKSLAQLRRVLELPKISKGK